MLKVFDFLWQWNIEFEIESESFLIVFVDVWTISCPCESNTPFLKVSKDDRKWQDYVYIQCEYKSTKQKIKHLLREENKVKENKIS